MNFNEWIGNHLANGLLSETEIHNMRTAWDVAIDEAAQIIFSQGEYLDPHDLIMKIKELKQ
jgi:hypothetical protein